MPKKKYGGVTQSAKATAGKASYKVKKPAGTYKFKLKKR